MIKDPVAPHTEIEHLIPGLRRYANALVALDSPEPARDADALTRDTVARALRVAAGGPDLRIWLYATLTTLNRVRARARGGDAPAFAGADSAGQGVTDALTALSLDQREVYLLVVLEGLTYAEASDTLGLSRAVVAARVARSRAFLEDRLDVARRVADRARRQPPYLRLVK